MHLVFLVVDGLEMTHLMFPFEGFGPILSDMTNFVANNYYVILMPISISTFMGVLVEHFMKYCQNLTWF